MAVTYDLVASTVLSTTASSVTLSAIPSTYTSLRLVISTFGSNTATCRLQFNGDTGNNYGIQFMTYTGSATPSANAVVNESGIYITGAQYGGSPTYPGLFEIDILGYASTTYMTAVNHCGGHAGGTNASEWFQLGGAWYNTAVVNSLTITRGSGTFNAGSSVRLYGFTGA